MNDVYKQLIKIAKQLDEICQSQIKQSSLVSQMLASPLYGYANNMINIINKIAQDYYGLFLLAKGKINVLLHILQPLNKYQETINMYDKFKKFFKKSFNSMPANLKKQCKKIKKSEFVNLIDHNECLKTINNQLNQNITNAKNKLNYLDNQFKQQMSDLDNPY